MTVGSRARTALITGAGRGLGAIMAQAFAAAGTRVALVARSRDQLEQLAAGIIDQGGMASVHVADVTNRAQVDAAVTAAEDALGPLDILINNAGVDEPFGPIGVIDPDAWWQAQAVHVLGPMYFMSRVVPGMAARGGGTVISICSLAGNVVVPNMSAYAVGKCTEIRLTQHVAEEWGSKGVAAFAIEPGTILTSMAEHTLASADAQQWIPGGIAYLKSISKEQSEASKVRLVEMVTALASGRYGGLSGRYLEPGDDFDALLAETNAKQ